MSPKWLIKGQIIDGKLQTAPCSELQVAELMGTKRLGGSAIATQRPTMHESETLGIKNAIKFAEYDND